MNREYPVALQSLSNPIPIPFQSHSNLSGLEWDRYHIGKRLASDTNDERYSHDTLTLPNRYN
ncbi:MAG TPA: hypothetical protein PLE74_00850 [Candidatus Cloacimonadota bacterium]|nr:hypothetical protein [Candidatus Cloacimonadota bacterium]